MTKAALKILKGFMTLTIIFICSLGLIALLDLFGLLFYSLRCEPLPTKNLISKVGHQDMNLGSSFDEKIGYHLNPGANLRYYDEDFYQNTIYKYRSDLDYVPYPGLSHFGHRDMELWNPTADIRILHLGDSFSFGVNVEIEETWRVLLRQYLRGNGYSVTSMYSALLSTGDSYGTFLKTKSYLDILEQINPNYIIHNIYIGNDIRTATFYKETKLPGSVAYRNKTSRKFRKSFKPFSSTLVNNFYWCLRNYAERSYIYVWFQYLTGRGALAKKETREGLKRIDNFNLYFRDYDFMINATGPVLMAPMATIVYLDKDPTLQKGLENIVEGVINLNDLCREKGIQLVVYLFPSTDQVYWDDIVSIEPRYQQYDPMKPNRYIVEKLSANNIIIYDLTSDMKKAKDENICYYFPIDMHWTVSGNRKAFELIKNHFISSVIAPPANLESYQ